MTTAVCATCGASFSGRFCGTCGARAISAEDLKVKPALTYALNEADIPTRIGKTLWTLVAKPGELTRAYVAGATKQYVNPVRLLLAAVAVYFLIAGPYWLSVNVEQSMLPTPDFSADDGRMLDAWQDAVINIQSISRLLGPIGLCLVMLLMRVGQREPFGHHLIFAVHYYCFDYVWAGLLAGASALVSKIDPEFIQVSWWIPIFGGLWLWAVIAIKTAYGARWWVALLVGSLVIVYDVMATSLADGIAVGYATAQFATPTH